MRKLTIEELNDNKPTRSRLTIVKRCRYHKDVVCKCICGNTLTVRYGNFIAGTTMSCGCLRNESGSQRGITIKEVNRRRPLGSNLTALYFGEYKINPAGVKVRMIVAKCKCGNIVTVMASYMYAGRFFTCRCNVKNKIKPSSKKHKYIPAQVWRCYYNMLDRCYNKKYHSFNAYGGRGVKVCKEWLRSFHSFAKWALSNGWKIGLQLDKDIKGNGLLYSPNKCLFVTQEENSKYKRRGATRMLKWKGKIMSLQSICKLENVSRRMTYWRVFQLGWTLSDAITRPKTN